MGRPRGLDAPVGRVPTRMPLLLLSAGDDPPNVQPDGAVTSALAGRGGKTLAFAGMSHGWVTRGDLADAHVAGEVERAVRETLGFLGEHLK